MKINRIVSTPPKHGTAVVSIPQRFPQLQITQPLLPVVTVQDFEVVNGNQASVSVHLDRAWYCDLILTLLVQTQPLATSICKFSYNTIRIKAGEIDFTTLVNLPVCRQALMNEEEPFFASLVAIKAA